ncbi:MAG: hypothetical protein R3C59_19915 [Planctomycetaceae bacterium]
MSVAQAPSRRVSASAQNECPNCFSRKPWGENSWCPECGYYPTVDAGAPSGKSWADSLPEVKGEEVDERTALQSIPKWFWLMIAGMVTITLSSVGIRYQWDEQEASRGMIALTQLAISVISMLIAHIIAARFAMKGDRRLKAQDVLLSWFNVWQPTISTLPQGCRRLLVMVWGIMGTITAVAVIGGIDYSAPFRTEREAVIKPKDLVGAVVKAAKSQSEDAQKPATMEDALAELQTQVDDMKETAGMSLEDAVNDFTGTSDTALDHPGNPDPETLARMLQEGMEHPTLNCYVYGVVTDRQKVPVAFLFAANTLGQEQHVAEVSGKDMDKSLYRRIVMRLYQQIQPEPEIPTRRKAVWVKPVVTCRLAFGKLSRQGELVEPVVEDIMDLEPGQSESTDKVPTDTQATDTEATAAEPKNPEPTSQQQQVSTEQRSTNR